MSYTPMSDLGQQGLFDITRTLLQQPDLASLCEALSQLVKRSALADNAAIVLWQAQTQRASYYASREKDTPIKYEDETVLAHGPVRSILSRPDTLHCSYEEFCETWPQLAAGGLYPKFGHYCLMPLAAEGHIFGGCEFIRYDDRPWSEKEFNRLQTFTQIVSVVTEQIQNAANGEFWASRAHLSPRKNWLITSDIITVQGTILNTGKDVHDTLTCGKITRKNPGISSRFKPAHPSLKGQSARPPRYR